MLELLTDNSQNKFLMYQEKLEEALMANEIDTSKYVVLDGRGYRTKTDLTRLRPILVGGLIFLIVCTLLSLFLPLGMVDRVVCLIGIAIFLAFTAYDTQKIRTLYTAYQGDTAMLERASIYSALQLYLDFINLFLYLLRFLGKSRK